MDRILLLLLLFLPVFAHSQNEIKENTRDSTQYISLKEKLDGCWYSAHYQFKYISKTNSGGEFKSKIHSSAPIFVLTLKDKETYIEWIELTGGSNFQKVIRIKANKLIVKNDAGRRVIYKRNKECR